MSEMFVAPETHSGRVKWFDRQKGFGFVRSEALSGDVMLHKSRLVGHGMKYLPEGALVEFELFRGDKGLQVERLLSVDLKYAVPESVSGQRSGNGAKQIEGQAGDFEPCEVKWFNHVKGYGFLVRLSDGAEVFVHADALMVAQLRDTIAPGDRIEARIGKTGKGLAAPVVRRPQNV